MRRATASRRDRASSVTIHWALLLFGLLAACGSTSPAVKHVRSNARDHVYDVPLSEVWPYALQLLDEQGFEIESNKVRDSESVQFGAQTLWTNRNYKQIRYTVSGKEFTDGTSKIVISRQNRELNHHRITIERDLDLEWALLRLVDPAKAAEIEAAGPSE